MVPSADGNFVRYDDAAAEISRLRCELAALQEKVLRVEFSPGDLVIDKVTSRVTRVAGVKCVRGEFRGELGRTVYQVYSPYDGGMRYPNQLVKLDPQPGLTPSQN